MPAARRLLYTCLTLSLLACSKSSDDYLKEGQAAIEKQDFNQAVIALKNAVQQAPESAKVRIALGEALERAGKLNEAEDQYARAIELGASSDELVPRIAVLALENREPSALLRKYGSTQLNDAAAMSNLSAALATAALADRKPSEARQFIQNAKQSTPSLTLAKAQLDFIEGKREQALAQIAELQSKGSLPWNLWRGIGRLYAVAGQEEQALAAAEKAYQAMPGHPELQAALAEAYLALGKLAEGKKLRDQLMQTAPGHYRSQFIDAYLKLQEGRPEEAHTQAQRVLASAPEHYPALIIAGKIELSRGELASAEARARKAVGVRDTAPEAYRLLSEALLAQRKTAEASTWITRGLVLAPNDERLLSLQAETQWQTGKRQDAVATLDKLRTNPASKQTAALTVRQAEMQFELGQKDKALSLLAAAEQHAGSDEALRERIFQVALRGGQRETAQRLADQEIAKFPNKAAPRMWRAAIAGSAGQQAEAIQHTLEALDVQADYYPALLALRASAQSRAEKDTVISRLKKAMDAKTTDARVYIDAAIMLRADNAAPDEVLAVLERGIAAAPTSITLRESATNHLLSLNQVDKALSIAQAGQAADPASPAMETLLASVLQAKGDHQQAAQIFGQLITRFPDQPSLHIRQAEALVRAGQADQAINLMKKAIASFPDDMSVHTTLAALQVQAGQAAEALTTISILRDRKSWAPQGYIMQGDVFVQTKRYEDALKSYAKASELGAEGPAQLRRITVLDKISESPKADRELNTWLATHPTDLTALQFASQRASQRNQHKEAIAYLSRLNQQAPGHAAVLNDLAWQKIQAGDPSALADARAAYALAPSAPAVVDTLGLALAMNKQTKEAIEMLRKAVQLAPAVPDIRLHLAMQLAANGDRSEARKLLDEIDGSKLNGASLQDFNKLKSSL